MVDTRAGDRRDARCHHAEEAGFAGRRPQRRLADEVGITVKVDETPQACVEGRHRGIHVGPVVHDGGLDAPDAHALQAGEHHAVCRPPLEDQVEELRSVEVR